MATPRSRLVGSATASLFEIVQSVFQFVGWGLETTHIESRPDSMRVPGHLRACDPFANRNARPGRHIPLRRDRPRPGRRARGRISLAARALPCRRSDRRRVPAAAPAQRPVHPAPRADVADRRPVRRALVRAGAASWRGSRANTTAVTVTSRRGRTSSSTGCAWKTRPTSSRCWRRWRCTRSRPAATACGTSRPTSTRGSPPDEEVDPRPVAEVLRQWSTFHPEFTYLPRKFKIAINGAREDRAATAFHDIGFRLWRDAAGTPAGAGLGRRRHGTDTGARHRHSRRPRMAAPADLHRSHPARLQPARPARQHLQGTHQDPRPRAGSRGVHATGGGGVAASARRRRRRSCRRNWIGSAAHFIARPRTPREAGFGAAVDPRQAAAFERWRMRCVRPQRDGRCCVVLSLKPTGVAPGDASDTQLESVADWAERYGASEVRVTHEQNLVIPHVGEDALPALWAEARAAGLATPNLGLLTDIISLPRRRLLLAGQCEVDPDRRSDPAALRRPRLPARHRGAEPEHLGVHQFVRPPPCRSHRHPRRRQGRVRVVPGVDRRRGRVRALEGPRRHRPHHRTLVRRRRSPRRDRASDRRRISASGTTASVSSTPWSASDAEPFKRRVYEGKGAATSRAVAHA